MVIPRHIQNREISAREVQRVYCSINDTFNAYLDPTSFRATLFTRATIGLFYTFYT